MRAKFEQFFLAEWQRASAWQLFLRPVSWLYAAVVRLRSILYRVGIFRTTGSPVPVIVVGNISVGGTGKTPVVLALTEYLKSRHMQPGIVMRGYQLNARDPSTKQKPASSKEPDSSKQRDISDEVLLLRQRSGVPVFADKKRVNAIASLLAEHADINIIITDDGLQHLAMARDIEIAVIDAARGLGNGYLLPAGPLRESVLRLKNVDCVIFNNTNIGGQFEANMAENTRQIKSLILSVPAFAMTYGAEAFSLVSHAPKSQLTIAAFLDLSAGKKIAAIAGIGNPQRFFTHLAHLGISLNSTHAFSDHHAFSQQDLMVIDADIILMTEKDAVKCVVLVDAGDAADAAHTMHQQLWQMQIDAILPAAFTQFIDEKLSHVTRPKIT